MRDITDDEIRVDILPDEDRVPPASALRWPTIPASSPALARALALVGANVVDARTFTTKDGFATAAF